MPLPRPKVHEHELRGVPRAGCRLPAILRIGSDGVSCLVEDLGVSGCRIAVETWRLSLGLDLRLEVPSERLAFAGRVTWMRIGEAGIEFTGYEAFE